MFGKDALKAVIRQNADASSEAIIQAVYEALADFRRQRPIEDDVTLVVVKVLS
jgi:sigma-B regulation protein RsbU (phosphoserine phosphatase)